MINNRLSKAINAQINEEFYSAYLYLSMASFCHEINMHGFGNWFDVQFREEMDHAIGFYNYLIERGGKIELEKIEKPPVSFDSLESLFPEALKHEKHITGKISRLYEMAGEEKDYPLMSFLKWYIDEQVEEEANATEMVEKVKLLGTKGSALYLLDKELMGRQYKKASILSEN